MLTTYHVATAIGMPVPAGYGTSGTSSSILRVMTSLIFSSKLVFMVYTYCREIRNLFKEKRDGPPHIDITTTVWRSQIDSSRRIASFSPFEEDTWRPATDGYCTRSQNVVCCVQFFVACVVCPCPPSTRPTRPTLFGTCGLWPHFEIVYSRGSRDVIHHEISTLQYPSLDSRPCSVRKRHSLCDSFSKKRDSQQLGLLHDRHY